MKYFYKLGMCKYSPRWLKIWCLKMILKRIASMIKAKINSATPEQIEALNRVVSKNGKFSA